MAPSTLLCVVRRQFNCNPGDWLHTNLVLSCGQQLISEWTMEWILIVLVIHSVWNFGKQHVCLPSVSAGHLLPVTSPNPRLWLELGSAGWARQQRQQRAQTRGARQGRAQHR